MLCIRRCQQSWAQCWLGANFFVGMNFSIVAKFSLCTLENPFKNRRFLTCFRPGLPDGIFWNQKSQFGYILECLTMKDVAKFYCSSVYFTAFPNILFPFCTFCGHFGIYFPFWYVVPRKIWHPCFRPIHQRWRGWDGPRVTLESLIILQTKAFKMELTFSNFFFLRSFSKLLERHKMGPSSF
jgi:hypothetical protein